MIPFASFLCFLLSFNLCQFKAPGIHLFVTFQPLLSDSLHANIEMNEGKLLRCVPERVPKQTVFAADLPARQQRAEQGTAVEMFPRNILHCRQWVLLPVYILGYILVFIQFIHVLSDHIHSI